MFVAAFVNGFLCIIFLACLYDRFRRSRRLLVKIPGDTSWPIVGNSLPYLKSPVELFRYLRFVCKKYGPIFQMHAINCQTVGTVDPKLVEIVLSSPQYSEKHLPYNFLKPWLNEGLLVSNGNKWYHRRKLLTQAFHFNILKRYTMTFTEKTKFFLELLEHVSEERVNIIPLITSTTIEIMCETAMGTLMKDDIKSVANKYWKAIDIIGLSVFDRLRKPIIHSNFIYQLTNNAKAQKKALADVHFFTRRIIDERRIFLEDNNINHFGDSKDYGKKGNVAMLDLLLQNQKIGNIDDAGIKEEVDTFMFEGHDTTAQALIYLLMLIANETTAQNKIYEELKNIFGDSQRTPTMEDLHNMKYLECCIKECLRLYPSVPIIMRYLKEETTLGDYVLPSNTHVHIPIFDLHRREDIYPEPESFIPERFLPENTVKRHPFAYIPFSAGPRNCIGQKFAMLEIKTLVSSLLRQFRLEAVTKPTDLMFRTDIILRTAGNPIYVKFHKRERMMCK